MAQAFKGSLINGARQGFGTYTKKQSYYDLLNTKNVELLYQHCNNKVTNQGDYIKLKNLKNKLKCEASCTTLPIDKGNLIINLITKEDLQGVVVVQSRTGTGPSTIDASLNPFYTYYIVDPNHVLNGTNPCQLGAYRSFLVLSTPSTDVVVQPSQTAGC